MTIAGKYQPKTSQILPRGRSGGSGHVPFENTADIAATVALAHARQHTLVSVADHTSAATSGQMLKANANGLPIDAANTDTEVASAVTLKHTQGTDQGLDTGGANAVVVADVKDAVTKRHVAVTVSAPVSLSGQLVGLVNDAAAAVTEIDTGALANSDTVIPTSKAITTALIALLASVVCFEDSVVCNNNELVYI